MVYCSKKCQIFSTTVCALIWAAVFIVAMLVPYIIQQAQNKGVEKLIVIDKNTWTQKQWDNYTVSTLNMTYYIWNATNLDAVMNDADGKIPIKWQEVGPFNISKISHTEVLSGESGSSGTPYLRYRKLTTYKISDESTRRLLSQPIVAVNSLWVGALSRGAQSLYAGAVTAQGLATAEQKANQALDAMNITNPQARAQTVQGALQQAQVEITKTLRAYIYPELFIKESLFYGALTQGWLSGAAVQFTALNSTNFYTHESALIPALRILSVGKYLEGAITTLSADPSIISILNTTFPNIPTARVLPLVWGLGQPNRANTIALKTQTPFPNNLKIFPFRDFELPVAINRTSIDKAWNTEDKGVTAVALVTVEGLRNWGVALQCIQLGGIQAPSRCNAQQSGALRLIMTSYGTDDFITILSWLAGGPTLPSYQVNLLDTTNQIRPTWRRTYTEFRAIPNTWLYNSTSGTPAERFQQIIIGGFEQILPRIGADLTNTYVFAPTLISEADGTVAEAKLAAAATFNQIQSFYDIALLQYATGWVVSLALPSTTDAEKVAGVSVSKPEALGASAGFGAQIGIANEPIEFSAAVQLVDQTIPIPETRLTFVQARNLLEYVQGRAIGKSNATVTQSIIAFGLVSEAAIRFSQGAIKGAIETIQKSSTPNITHIQMLAKYLQLRTSAVFEGINVLRTINPTTSVSLPAIWDLAKKNITGGPAGPFMVTFPLFISAASINETTGANLRSMVAYFHSYFRRLQGGVGPNKAQYTVNDNSQSSIDAVTREGYNSVFGVSTRTNGLFIQRTGFEFLFGGRSHLPNAELNPILSPTTTYLDEDYREYDNKAIYDGKIIPGANPIMLSAVFQVPYEKNTLEEAKKRNALVYQGQETSVNTGRMNIDAVGQYHTYNGLSRYSTICEYLNPGQVAGTIKADETSRIPNEVLRSPCVAGTPQDYYVYKNGWVEEIADRVNDPAQFQPFREGSSNILPSIATFITELARTVSFNYTGDVTIKGIDLRRYQLDSKYLFKDDAPNNTLKNDNYRQTAVPGYYPDAPDGMVSGWYYAGAPIYISKPHFYQVTPQVTNVYAADSFKARPEVHETYLDVEPLSGKTLHARKRLQANVYVTGSMIDSSPHLEPLFKNGENSYTGVKYLPYYWAEEAGTITDDDAETFKTNIYKAREIGKIIQIVVGVISALLFVICVALVVRSCSKQPEATTDK